jgi:selenocysteine-specific elongation factor
MKSVVVGTAGHIDHGKSALVHALTGTDPDRLKEEKARGITIDLGFAHLTAGDVNLAFIDVPGHERFVKNMLAGVGGIDLVLFVVAADESVMPQTREHFEICRLLRVRSGIIALTKTDLVDGDTLDLVRLEIGELVADSFLATAPVVPVSTYTHEGLDALRAALVDAAASVRGRSAEGVARLPIDRVFSMKGFGTIATGTLTSGRIKPDDELIVAPGEWRVKVRGVQVHGRRCDEAVAGQRTALNLSGIEVRDLSRGETLMAEGAAERTRIVDAAIELLRDAKAIEHAARVRFHQGTAEILARVSVIGPQSAPSSALPNAPVLEPGTTRYVRLRLERAAVLTRGDRFIVRSYSPAHTIAGGRVLDPLPPRGATRTDRALQRCQGLDAGTVASDEADDLDRLVGMLIEEAARSGLPTGALVSRCGMEPGLAMSCVRSLVERGIALEIDQRLVDRRIVERLAADLVEALAHYHRADPSSQGLGREEARIRLFRHGYPPVFNRVVEQLEKAGTIVARDRLALSSHRVGLSSDAERARQPIEQVYRSAGLAPPDLATVTTATGAPAPVIDQVLRFLQRQRVLVKLDSLLFHEEALEQLKLQVAALKLSEEDVVRIDVPAFKERFGVTRKFAIPLLEYLDRERVTRRVGDARLIL